MNMQIRFIVFIVMFMTVKSDDDSDVDLVINMLLNGESFEVTDSDEGNLNDAEPQFVDGVWQCGNCSDLRDAELADTQTNEVYADQNSFHNVDYQVSVSMDSMRCVTVSADRPGAVKKVLGSCTGSTVTLSMAPSNNFTLRVYK